MHTWVGKVTYERASYWHQLLSMFDTATHGWDTGREGMESHSSSEREARDDHQDRPYGLVGRGSELPMTRLKEGVESQGVREWQGVPDGKEYSYSGALLNWSESLSNAKTSRAERMREKRRFVKTRPYEYVNISPSLPSVGNQGRRERIDGLASSSGVRN